MSFNVTWLIYGLTKISSNFLCFLSDLCVFKRVLFSIQMFEDFPDIFLLLIFSLITF